MAVHAIAFAQTVLPTPDHTHHASTLYLQQVFPDTFPGLVLLPFVSKVCSP